MKKVEFIAKFGPERYEKLLKEQKERNRKRFEDPEIKARIRQRSREYGRTHKHNKSRILVSQSKRILTDEEYLNDIISRVVGKAVIAFLGIKKNGYEVHHCFGTKNLKSFVYLPKDAHRKIHSIFGYKNSMCQWNKIRQYLVDNLIPFTLVENAKITFRRF